MSKLKWDQLGERRFETGVNRGVLYLQNEGEYDEGYAWNGLTAVTESPSGAESSKQYADNIVYLNLQSAEEFGGTIEAFTYPDAFEQCDGAVSPVPGVSIGQQGRRSFGLSYVTRVGNDVKGVDFGYKIHLVYQCLAAPSERAYNTINDSPEATGLSWELTTTPIEVGVIEGVEYKPTAILKIDSTMVDADTLAELEDILYGTDATDPRLPLPAEVIAMFGGSALTNAIPVRPAFDTDTKVITIPTTTGVIYKINGVTQTAGAKPPITVNTIVKAVPAEGFKFPSNVDNDFGFTV